MEFTPHDDTVFVPIPMGRYRGRVTKMEMVDDDFHPGEQKPRWSFDVGEVTCLDGTARPVTLTAKTSTKASNTSKYGKSLLWKLAEAVGVDPSRAFTEGDIIGRDLVLIVIEEERKDGNGVFSKINNYESLPQNGQANGQQAARPAQQPAQGFQQGNQQGHQLPAADDPSLPF